jgi:hypothetical protein
MKTFATAVMAPLFAVALAAPGAQAQTTPAQTPQPRDTAGQNTATTIVGCLYREAQVPGRSPNVAERAGVLEDYILVSASASSDAQRSGTSAGATSTAGTPGTTGAAGSTAAGRMFKVEGIDDERLKAMVGKRVEVSGRVDSDVEGRRDKSMGPDQINVAEFEAQSIKEVSGSCPATPAPGQ